MSGCWRMVAGVAVLAMAAVFAANDAAAHARRPPRLTVPSEDAALVIDGKTRSVLFARNEAAPRHPASLTKMMTLYLLFERLRFGQLTLQTALPITPNAAAQLKQKLGLRAGGSIPVDLAIDAVAVESANDAAVVVAEAVGGTESHFAEMMNAKARAFGMTQTFYRNASGLPDALQITSARDLAVLARHLVYDFPEYFHYFSTPSFAYGGTTYQTHDRLVGSYEGCDGIKTGYTDASGYNIVSTVQRSGRRIIAVVMGGVTANKRDRAVTQLLDAAFAQQHGPAVQD